MRNKTHFKVPKKLTRKSLAEAKKDLQLLTDPSSLCYSDGYYANSLRKKWVDFDNLGHNIKQIETEIKSMAGAGI